MGYHRQYRRPRRWDTRARLIQASDEGMTGCIAAKLRCPKVDPCAPLGAPSPRPLRLPIGRWHAWLARQTGPKIGYAFLGSRTLTEPGQTEQ